MARRFAKFRRKDLFLKKCDSNKLSYACGNSNYFYTSKKTIEKHQLHILKPVRYSGGLVEKLKRIKRFLLGNPIEISGHNSRSYLESIKAIGSN